MADLMDRALRDPLYLRLGFRPDCQLHHQPPSKGPRLFTTAAYDDTDDNGDDNDDGDAGNRDGDDDVVVYVTSKKHGDGGDVIVDVRKTPSASPYWTKRPEVPRASGALRHRFEITVTLGLIFAVHSILSLVTSFWNVFGVVHLDS